MLIPSIDLMAGKIVQLVQGEKKALEFDDFDAWTARFAGYPMVQVIDLDAAMGKGSNADLVERFCERLACQVGGGIRSLERVREVLSRGAKKVIIGSALFTPPGVGSGVNAEFALELARSIGEEKLIFAIDSRAGRVAVSGWKETTELSPADAARVLDPYCSAFLYTNIDSEGMMQGFPFEHLEPLRSATSRKLIVAGGITTQEEIDRLDQIGIDAVVGMAIYTGRLNA